jgi:hypothetical protein
MKENEIIKEARKLFYKFEVIPEATAEEKAYNKKIFDIKGRPEEYPAFYNRCMVKRYKLYINTFSYEYYDPIIFYTISQLQAYTEIQKAINAANENCDWQRADDLYIRQESFINSITPPEVYTA